MLLVHIWITCTSWGNSNEYQKCAFMKLKKKTKKKQKKKTMLSIIKYASLSSLLICLLKVPALGGHLSTRIVLCLFVEKKKKTQCGNQGEYGNHTCPPECILTLKEPKQSLQQTIYKIIFSVFWESVLTLLVNGLLGRIIFIEKTKRLLQMWWHFKG